MYAVRARTVSREDLEHFAFNQRFWLSNKTEVGVEYNDGAWVGKPFDNNKKVYIWPYIQFRGGNYSSYSVGSHYQYSVGGIDDWYIGSRSSSNSNSTYNYMELYAYNPVEIQIDSSVDVEQEILSYFNTFRSDSNIYSYGSKPYKGYDTIDRNFFYSLNDITYFADFSVNRTSTMCTDSSYQPKISDQIGYDIVDYKCLCMYKYTPENKSFDSCYNYQQHRNKQLKLGYRPVVTLKIDAAKDISKKDISSKLKIGDYVNYSAKNYSGWRVLSIDNEAGTVDIVSSGVVKNIQLYGIDDYENYDIILSTNYLC